MENEYNYYNPNDGEDIFDEQTGERKVKTERRPRNKKKMPRWAVVCGTAIAFGVIASGTFLGTNAVVSKLTGTSSGVQIGAATASKDTDSGIKLNQSSNTVTSDVSGIVDQAMPSVVSITNMSVQEVQSFFGNVQQQESESAGSGIIIGKNDTELLIVTNNHVVENAKTLTVAFVDDEAVEASIKGTDPTKDLAVVAVPLSEIKDETMEKIQIITLGDSDKLQVGEPVIAIGNALGYGQSVTTGIVSALNRDLDMENFDSKLIQTDAAINPGNSGGALLNANGELIGINTVKVNANAVEGMGYAIPISDASEVIENLMNRETRTKVAEEEQGYLGIRPADVTSESAEMYSMPSGVYVRDVIKDGSAEKAGITKGSVITKLDGITIDSIATLQEQLAYYKVGDKVELVVQVPTSKGEYKEQTINVTLGKRSE